MDTNERNGNDGKLWSISTTDGYLVFGLLSRFYYGESFGMAERRGKK